MTTALLSCAGRPVGRYGYRPGSDSRPYLHPVTTLAGTPVTEERPADHLHHLGASVAVPDVAGHNFWGGRTYVRDQGPTELDNHGTQRHLGWKLRDPDGFVEELSWRPTAPNCCANTAPSPPPRSPAPPGHWTSPSP